MLRPRQQADLATAVGLTDSRTYFTRGKLYPPGTYRFRYIGGAFSFGLAEGQPDYCVQHAGIGACGIWFDTNGFEQQQLIGQDFSSTVPADVYATNRADPVVTIQTFNVSRLGLFIYDDFYGDNAAGPVPVTFQLAGREA